MFEYKKISKKELNQIIIKASQKLGLNETVVEKDYWVCFVLNYLFSNNKWKKHFAFKGGTSLSKCYNLIERFSEDIDLILDWRIIGCGVKEPWEERSNAKQDKFNKECNLKTEKFLENVFLPQMNKDFKEILDDNFVLKIDEKDKQTILFEYPKIFTSSYLTHSIRLEIGTLATWTPTKIISIIPDIKKVYPILFKGENINVRAVLPERTFWEKATILHHEANRPKELKMPKRYARHYYDLFCIANTDYKYKAFKDLELLKKVIEFKQKFYPRKWAEYENANYKTIKLMPSDYRLNDLRKDYESMSEMLYGIYPSFDELMLGIYNLENEIHNIK